MCEAELDQLQISVSLQQEIDSVLARQFPKARHDMRNDPEWSIGYILGWLKPGTEFVVPGMSYKPDLGGAVLNIKWTARTDIFTQGSDHDRRILRQYMAEVVFAVVEWYVRTTELPAQEIGLAPEQEWESECLPKRHAYRRDAHSSESSYSFRIGWSILIKGKGIVQALSDRAAAFEAKIAQQRSWKQTVSDTGVFAKPSNQHDFLIDSSTGDVSSSAGPVMPIW